MPSKKRISVFVIIAALVGALVGARITPPRAESASVLDNILNFLKKNLGATTSQPLVIPPSATSTPQKAPAKTESSEPPTVLYKPALDYEEAVIRAVEKAAPSVVSIVISKDLPIIERCPYNPFPDLPPEFRDFFGFEFYEPCEKGTERKEVGGGTGFIVSEDGLILTNKHVVSDTKAGYTVLTNDGKKHEAKVLARDPAQDLAIIKINASNLTPAKLSDSDTLKLGQTVIAIGNALGEFRNTVSVGVVSGLARDITASGGGIVQRIEGLIQTDAAINQGNSGGPLLNLKGEVVAINTAIVAGAQNIGFAIPINQAKRDIASVKKTGAIKTPYLGVHYFMVTEEIAQKQKLPVDYGALVRGTEDGPAVMPSSPAAKAGLQDEDIILEVNGTRIDKTRSLANMIQGYNIGDTVSLEVRRGEQILTIQVRLEERPEI